MTQVHSFGNIYPIAHANITSGIWVNKYDLQISHDELLKCLQQMETVMGDDAPGLCDTLTASNGFTLIMTPTLVEDLDSTQSPGDATARRYSHQSPAPMPMSRLAFIMDSGKAFLLEFSPEFTQRYQMSLRHTGPQGFMGAGGFPPGQGHYQGPPPGGFVGQAPWLQQLGYLTGMVRFAGYNETHGNGYKGFAK